MKTLVCSDVHGNIRALDAVLGFLEGIRPCRLLFLGDAVGYGAHPGECLDRLLGVRESVLVLGNHDWAVLDLSETDTFHEEAATVIEWTAERLGGRYNEALIKKFDLKVETDLFIATHGSPFHPEEFSYIFSSVGADEAFEALDFSLCFTGHTHIPMVYTYSSGPESLDEGEHLVLDPSDRYIVNPGSVGQPRDGDNRASFVIFEPEKRMITQHRLEYDIEAEARDIIGAGLPEWLAERLFEGR